MKQSVYNARIPGWLVAFRTISELVLRLFFPAKVIDRTGSLKKANLAAESGKGLIIIFTHFSLRDAMEISRSIIFRDPVLKYRDFLNPLSYHQYNTPIKILSKIYRFKFAPVVNNSTLAKERYKHLPKGLGLNNFVEKGKEMLNNGGTVILAVNATRKEKLDIEDKQRPIGYFVASMQALNVKNYGFLLTAPSIKNAKNYSKQEVGGMNFWKTCVINIADYYTLEELLNHPEVNGKMSNIDSFIRARLAKVVPKSYLPSDT